MYVACRTLEVHLPSIMDSVIMECAYRIQFLDWNDCDFLYDIPNSDKVLNVLFITLKYFLSIEYHKIDKRQPWTVYEYVIDRSLG